MNKHTAFGIGGIILGGLLVGVPLGVLLLNTIHHYKEHKVFFRGRLGNCEVRGISYFDYHGFGIMEGNQWRVDLIRPNNPEPTTIYHGKPVFHEALPHQPEISIRENRISIDDGEQVLTVHVSDTIAGQASDGAKPAH